MLASDQRPRCATRQCAASRRFVRVGDVGLDNAMIVSVPSSLDRMWTVVSGVVEQPEKLQ